MQFGVFSASDMTADALTGYTPRQCERLAGVLRVARTTEAVGLDVFSIAEHHNPPYISSSPATILAAVAAQTTSLILVAATTLLSTNDPLRMAEEYATLDQLAVGRAEITLWRGRAYPAFPWINQPLDQSMDLRLENYHLLGLLWREENVEWEGRYRTPVINHTLTPRPFRRIPPMVWHSAVFSREIADQAAYYGDGYMANLVAPTTRARDLVEHYRERYEEYGNGDGRTAPVSLFSQVFVGKTSQEAMARVEPYYNYLQSRYGGSDLFNAALRTPLAVGSRQEVIEKILGFREQYGDYQRHIFLVDHMGLPLDTVLEQVETLGADVAPVLRREFDAMRPEGVPSDPPSHENRYQLENALV